MRLYSICIADWTIMYSMEAGKLIDPLFFVPELLCVKE